MAAGIVISPVALGFLAPAARRRLAGGWRLRLRNGERRVLRKRLPPPVSEWCEKHRVVTMGRYPGRWHNFLTPYSAGIMDAAFSPTVETVIVCKSPQTGISEAANNCVAFAADYFPGPALYVYPDEQTARENSRDRIQPMFTSGSRLKGLLTGIEDDFGLLRINLRSMPIYLAWAGSPARLGNKPIRHLVLDEVDKYPEFAGKKEASPIALAEKRTITFRGRRKIFKISTPTVEAGPIWQALTTEAEAVFEYWVSCPECGELQQIFFADIRWPADERDPERLESRDLARWRCHGCRREFDDHGRDLAVRAGGWYAAPGGRLGEAGEKRRRKPGLRLDIYLERRRPKKIAFHLPAWLSHFVSLSECAAAFLKSRNNPAKLRDFMNNFEARPWVIRSAVRREDAILRLRDDRPRGVVPGPVDGRLRIVALTAGVDTQDDGFYYEIRAWAPGPELESWQVAAGFVDSKDALLEILFDSDYRDPAGNRYIVNLAIQDAMGHRTAEVYDLTRKHRRRHLPYQGARSLTAPYTFTQLEFYPASRGRKIPIPGGLRLVRGNSGYFKDLLDAKLRIAPGDPGAWHLNAETTEEYARQLCAEFIDEKGIWQCKPNAANHFWDCAYLNLLAADILRLKTRRRPAAGGNQPSPLEEKTVSGSRSENNNRPADAPAAAAKKKTRRFW